MVHAVIVYFLLSLSSKNISPRALVQQRTALFHLANFLETPYKVTHLSLIEAVHLPAWLVYLSKEPGARGKSRIPRTIRKSCSLFQVVVPALDKALLRA
jgi:hypothetical protein